MTLPAVLAILASIGALVAAIIGASILADLRRAARANRNLWLERMLALGILLSVVLAAVFAHATVVFGVKP